MIEFKNGLTITGNPKIIITKYGILITNDFGLYLELSKNVWNTLTF